MRCSRIVRVAGIFLGVACLLCTSKLVGRTWRVAGPGFQLVGPSETAQLERGLGKRLGVYAWGIWPRTEKLEAGIPGPNLPAEYVARIVTWSERILRKEFLPKAMNANQWRGLPKANGYNDFIVGQWENADETVRVRFRATGLLLVVTATSTRYFFGGGGRSD